MAASAGFIETRVDRLQDTLRGWGEDLEQAQKDLAKRRKRLEKDAQKRIAKFRKEIEANRFVKRALGAREDVLEQVDERVAQLLGNFQIATQDDVKKLERKINALQRRLRELEG